MTGVDLAALRALASEATPGPWEGLDVDGEGTPWVGITTERGEIEAVADECSEPADARFIAACDPRTVLALVEAVEAALAYETLAHGFREGDGTDWPTVDKAKQNYRAALAPFRQEQPDG